MDGVSKTSRGRDGRATHLAGCHILTFTITISTVFTSHASHLKLSSACCIGPHRIRGVKELTLLTSINILTVKERR
jgi:hypothetical protein